MRGETEIRKRTFANLATLIWTGGAASIGLLFALAFWHDNYAKPVAIADRLAFRPEEGAPLRTRLDNCQTDGTKIAVAGWIARMGSRSAEAKVEVMLLDRLAQRYYAMKTSRVDRADVSSELNRQFGDKVNYAFSGYAASLNLRVADRDVAEGQVVVLYSDAQSRSIIPLPCMVRKP